MSKTRTTIIVLVIALFLWNKLNHSERRVAFPPHPFIANRNNNYIDMLKTFEYFDTKRMSLNMLEETDKKYEISLKSQALCENGQSIIDDILMFKAIKFILAGNYNEAIKTIDYVNEKYPDDCIFPGGFYFGSPRNFYGDYWLLLTTKNRDHCPVLKATILFKQSKFVEAKSILQQYIHNKTITDDFSEDIDSIYNLSDHPYFKKYYNLQEYSGKDVMAPFPFIIQLRPDKIALKLLMAISLTENRYSDFDRYMDIYQEKFPNSYKYIEKFRLVDSESQKRFIELVSFADNSELSLFINNKYYYSY